MKTLCHYFKIVFFIMFTASSVPALSHNIIFQNEHTKHTYTAEIAKTPAQRKKGLMFRTSIPPRHAMVFVYNPPQQVSMWMKNTFIPLDIIFVDENHVITHIHHNAIPEDLTPITSSKKVVYVIEINAYEAEKYGIAIGDRVGFLAKE